MNRATIPMRRLCGLVLASLLCAPSLFSQEEPPTPGPDYSADCTSSGCHDEYLGRKTVHDPVSTGDCDFCHEKIEGEEHRFSLLAEGSALCYECHDDLGEGRTYLHGPVAAGACTVCHDVHGSDYDALLTAEARTLCLDCHSDLEDRMNTLGYTHDPATEGCLDCHDPHGADNPMNLGTDLPGLCLDCHSEIEDALQNATHKHDAMNSERFCLSCHDPHAAAFDHILVQSPMAICLSCHDKTLGSGDDAIMDIAGLLAKNPDHHGPIREKNCSACHSEVHGGTHFRLLKDAYPAEFYAPFEKDRYALCFECHESDIVKDRLTDKLTNFRNGEVNLHFLHVNRDRKGRTCRACHETHASVKPFHIREAVPFGKSGWMIPINYEKTEEGGSCLPGCHKRYAYERVTPVINIPPPSGEK